MANVDDVTASRARTDAPFPDVGFVACIERGPLEAQALLLFESIRTQSGRFRTSPIYALSPRAGYDISRAARTRLADLDVHYIDAVLNTACPHYGSANRIAAAAHIEQMHPHEILVVLDSDTLFLAEPTDFLLPPEIDVAVRPVDHKGMCTSGPGDDRDAYWQALCRCCGVEYGDLPWSESSVDRQRIKASYNGGLAVVRGGLGIMQTSARFFFASIEQGLAPYAHARRFRSGVGWVDGETSTLWGTSQASLSLAIWNTTRRVAELGPAYNYPLHLHDEIDRAIRDEVFPRLVHVHYHWLFAKDTATPPLFDVGGPLSDDQATWLRRVIAAGGFG